MKRVYGIFIILFIAAMFNLTGCGDGGSSSDSESTPTELEGSWSQTDFHSSGTDKWTRETITYTGNSAVIEWELIWNSATKPLSTAAPMGLIKFNATFTIGADVTVPSAGSKKINYNFTSVTATPLTATAVSDWNYVSAYTLTGWTLNTEKVVTGLGDMPANGAIYYDVYKLDSAGLYIGDPDADDSYDGASDSARPQDFQDILL